jgi:glycosyltransferase involved in cell wall biosynthesis
MTALPATCRIAVVQHGDYREAQRLIGSGQPEPYFGMAYAVRVLGDLLHARPHLVISLDAPNYDCTNGTGRLVGLDWPRLPRFLPGTAAVLWRAHQVRRLLRQFQPTHLLLRTNGLLACRALQYAIGHSVSTLAVLASFFDLKGRYNRVITRWLIRLLNHPSVFLVGNHRAPATQTMIDCGLGPNKAVAWDWPGGRRPEDYPTKTLPAVGTPEIVYVGSVTEDKGVGDLVRALDVSRRRNVPARLTVAGDGPDLGRFRELAAALPAGLVTFAGRVPNEEAFRLMLRAALVCVPSRHEFTEGFPLTLTEALASRSPVIASDHPVFVRAFQDGQGVRYFKAADPESLAEAVRSVLADPAGYARLSELTADAFARVECKTAFGDLLERWRATF